MLGHRLNDLGQKFGPYAIILTVKCIRSCALPLVYKGGGGHVDP